MLPDFGGALVHEEGRKYFLSAFCMLVKGREENCFR